MRDRFHPPQETGRRERYGDAIDIVDDDVTRGFGVVDAACATHQINEDLVGEDAKLGTVAARVGSRSNTITLRER